MKRLLLLGPSLAIAACGREPSLMPLDQGRTWTYTFNAGFVTFVEPVEVRGKAAVGNSEGAILTGPMGTSRLGWQGDTLLAARWANAGFSPPLPVVVAVGGKGEAKRSWRGTIEAFGQGREATATMVQERVRIALGGIKVATVRSTVTIRAKEAGRAPIEIELTTWFRPGVGIVRQEQRTDRRLIVGLKLLDEG